MEYKSIPLQINPITIVQIYPDNVCCICLDTTVQDTFAKLQCCNIKIHNQCLINIVLHKFSTCPLCRKQLNTANHDIKKYFYPQQRHRLWHVCSVYGKYVLVFIIILLFYYILFELIVNFHVYSNNLFAYRYSYTIDSD